MTVKDMLMACAMLGLSATSAAAQLFNPGDVAAMGVQMAQQQEAEKACEAGRPPDPGIAADIDRRAEARLAQYFERIGGGDPGAITHLFIDSGRQARWTGPDGAQPVKALVDPVGAARSRGTLTRKAFVVGGDDASARGVWVLAVPDAADPAKTDTYEYGVDFKLGDWGGIWIWHMHLYRAPDTAPPPPDKFCHVAPATAS
jgi:hypothetical protein